MRLYSARAARWASLTGVITVDLASNQSCDFADLFPKVAKAVRYIVSGLRGAKFLFEDLSELLREIYLRHLDDIDKKIPLCLCTVQFLWLHPDLTAHQGVVSIAVRTVVRASVKNILDSSTPD